MLLHIAILRDEWVIDWLIVKDYNKNIYYNKLWLRVRGLKDQ